MRPVSDSAGGDDRHANTSANANLDTLDEPRPEDDAGHAIPSAMPDRALTLMLFVVLSTFICGVASLMLTGTLGRFQSGRVLWAGDAETGNLSQWASAVRVAPDRIQVVTSPARQGKYSYRFEVRQGDNPVPAYSTNDRAELGQANPGHGPLIYEGMDQWYGFSVMFDKSFPNASWQTFAQWKQLGPDPPPGGMSANNDLISFDMGGSSKGLAGNGGILFKTPLVRGRWNDFVLHVKWSPYASVGFVELWFDGKQVVPKTYTANMYRDSPEMVIPNYSRIGYYRNRAISQTGVLYIDDYKAGTSYDAVAP